MRHAMAMTLALASVLISASLPAQLPPEIQADRYLMQAEEKIGKQDFAAAKAALDRILDLQEEHGLAIPEAFYFRYAEVSERVGLYQEAVESVTRYLTMAGRDGEHYKDALELLNAVEAETFSAARTCEGKLKGSECWMELANEPECYVWNAYLHPGKTVTWTGECSSGLAQGTGTLKWVWHSDPKARDGSLSPPRAEPKCAGQPKGTACWMELTNQPECYVWNPNPKPDETVTWTGECSSGLAQGTGKLIWVWDGDKKTNEGKGRLQHGKHQGQWISLRTADGSTSTSESFYVDGEYVARTAESEEMEGRIVGGKTHGDWVYRFAIGEIHEGPYVKGKKHGKWVIRWADDNGDLSGNGMEGPYVEGKMHGLWVARWTNGNIEERPYVEGKRHGQLTGRDVDGNTWEGSYVEGKKHGQWTHRKDGEIRREGPWVNGEKHGRWTEKTWGNLEDEGPYISGKKHGKWFTRGGDGKIRIEEQYVDGKRHGRRIERDREGNVTKQGRYVKGEKHGRWTEIDYDDPYEVGVRPGRADLEGEYENGERVGQWTVRYRNGLVGNGPYGKPEIPENYSDLPWEEQSHYLSWHKHGQWTLTYRNDDKHEGPYVYGKKHGLWFERDSDGDRSAGPYVDGEKSGLWEWRNTEGRVEEGNYMNGKRVGRWVERFPETSTQWGRVQEGPYDDGERHGEWTVRWQTGRVDQGPYVDGERHGEWVRRKKEGGRINRRESYRNGRLVE